MLQDQGYAHRNFDEGKVRASQDFHGYLGYQDPKVEHGVAQKNDIQEHQIGLLYTEQGFIFLILVYHR